MEQHGFEPSASFIFVANGTLEEKSSNRIQVWQIDLSTLPLQQPALLSTYVDPNVSLIFLHDYTRAGTMYAKEQYILKNACAHMHVFVLSMHLNSRLIFSL